MKTQDETYLLKKGIKIIIFFEWTLIWFDLIHVCDEYAMKFYIHKT